MDYFGYMGVPITFMYRFCPEQFEIVGLIQGTEGLEGINLLNGKDRRPLVHGKRKFARIVVKRKQ